MAKQLNKNMISMSAMPTAVQTRETSAVLKPKKQKSEANPKIVALNSRLNQQQILFQQQSIDAN